jgi:hypothetical protein
LYRVLRAAIVDCKVMTGTEATPRLLPPELEEMLRLVRDADSVELKLTVPDEDRQSAVRALGIDPLNARIRQVFFFDTPDLLLDRAGVVVRARRTQGAPDDTVVKLRPVDPTALPEDLRAREDFVVEVDAMPGAYVCSGSFKGRVKSDAVMEAILGARPVRKLFSKAQRSFFEEHAPSGVSLDDLSVLGPVTAFKLKLVPVGLNRKLAVELWLYPDGSRILELSTKCAPADWFDATVESRDYLQGVGVSTTGEQATKTRAALEYFAALR